MGIDGDRGDSGVVPERSHEARREITSTADGPTGSPRRPRDPGRLPLRARHAAAFGAATRHEAQPDDGTRTSSTQGGNLVSPKRGCSTMLGLNRTSVTAMVAVLVGIAGLTFMLAKAG